MNKTITSIFIVPTLKIPREKLQENEYINGYIRDDRREVQYENSVYLLFRPKEIDKFKSFLDEEYERTKDLIDDYDYEDGYVVVVYKLDEKFKEDFELVKKGKYSKTSPSFQQLFPKIIKIKVNGLSRDEFSLQFKVFNKTEDLRRFWEERLGVIFDNDQEFWKAFIEENESLNLSKIKEYV